MTTRKRSSSMRQPFPTPPIGDGGLWGCFTKPEVTQALARGEHIERPSAGGGIEQRTPLHRACLSGLVEVAEALLQAGANANAVDAHGNGPLHILLAKESRTSPTHQDTILRTLLQQGARVRAKNLHGDTPLHRAAAKGNLPFCERIIEAGGDFGARNIEGETPADLLITHFPDLANTSPWKERLFELELNMILPKTGGRRRTG